MSYLKNISSTERQNVENFYNEMFDEQGIGLDDEVPESFGNPKKIAMEILAEDIEIDEERNERNGKKNGSFWKKFSLFGLGILSFPILPLLVPIFVICSLFLVFWIAYLVVRLIISLITLPFSIIFSLESVLAWGVKIIGFIILLYIFVWLIKGLYKMLIKDISKNPDKYTSLGGKIPRGALLVGPPGTGKTLLAKAVAGEAQVPFFSLSGSDFVEMFVGVGASRVRDLFKQAKEKAPAIIFIDEIDAIGRARGKNVMTGANDERENTLNQLLTEMDGFGSHTNVIVLAATNRADILDKALMRAGRFDRQIYVELPNLNERKQIFQVHLKPIKTSETLDIDFLAKQTPGFSGADIANVCNEAALIAARKGKTAVSKQEFLDAVDRIVGGLEKKSKILTPEERKAIAFHEAGHATVSWLLEYAAPLVKVTIVPRGQSLGAAWYLPEERQIVRTEQILDEMCAALGGRAAEKVIFDKISTGALSDLEKVTKQARAMVTIYGLNDKIGNLTYYDSAQSDYGFTKPYSERTAHLIDEEISKIIEEQYQRAIKILSENKEKLTILANLLLEREVIFRDDLENIFGKRKYKDAEEAIEAEIPAENKNVAEVTQ